MWLRATSLTSRAVPSGNVAEHGLARACRNHGACGGSSAPDLRHRTTVRCAVLRPLGVRLDDVGVGYPSLLEQSLGLFVFATMLAIPTVMFSVGSAWLWKRDTWDRRRSPTGRRQLIATLAVLPAVVIFALTVGEYVLLKALLLLLAATTAVLLYPR